MAMKLKMYNALNRMAELVDKLKGHKKLKAYNEKLKLHLKRQEKQLTGSDKKSYFNPKGKKIPMPESQLNA